MKFSPWRTRSPESSDPLTAESALWDQLLNKLELTEAEALEAIVEGKEAGPAIRRFVHQEFRDHFIPENVLLALSMERDATEAYL
jgi:hypothetical protein